MTSIIKPKILAFAGSLRKDSCNKKLVKIAMQDSIEAGADVTYIDLRDFPLPLYDGDLEEAEGLPQKAIELKKLMQEHQGFIIASPEYNSSFSGVLKNTIDWTSRKANPEEVYLSCFIDKVACLLSTSPSALGGIRGLVHLRSCLENMYTFVLPSQVTIGNGMNAFDSNGFLKDPGQTKAVMDLSKKLTKTLQQLLRA